MDYIVNATPMSYNRGINDVSGKKRVIAPEDLPTHLPKYYLYTQKGKKGITYLVNGDSRDAIFGSDSFDPLLGYANHATMFANGCNTFGSTMIERIVPDDAPPPAAMRLSLDLLPALVTQYQRNPDRTYKLDQAGALIPTGTTVQGFLGKFVVTPIGVDVDGASLFGQGAVADGDQTDASSETQSTRYPLQDFMTSSPGAWGDNSGIRQWANTVNSSTPIDVRLIEDQKVYPYFISVAARPDAISSAKVQTTLSGAQSIPFVLKPRTIDRNFGAPRYLGDVFVPAYNDTTTPGMPPTYGDFDQLHMYDANIANVLNMLYTAEFTHNAGPVGDFTGENDETYRFNLFGATDSTGAPYSTFQIVTGASNSARLSENNTLYAQGGGDGTMNNVLFGKAVAEKLTDYADKNSPVQEAAVNVESIFYDSGFPLATKLAFANVIALRKDLGSVVSCYDVDGGVLSDDDERSLATVLLTRFQMYPESSYYGTAATRACIVGGSGFVLNSPYTGRLPATYEIAVKAARAMGAGNGQWKKDQMFDAYPGSVMEFMRDISLPFRPAEARFKDWAANLVWPQPFNRSQFYFGAIQTINPDDTSVLNNFFTMMACIQLTKIGEAVHKVFSGTTELTADQLAERVDAEIVKRTKDTFAGRYLIVPNTVTTADDSLRGFSWTTTITIGANVSKTVQTLILESKRIEDMVAAA